MQTVDLTQVRALVKKEVRETCSAVRFDRAGFVLKIALVGVLSIAIVLFLGKFASIYLSVGESGQRLREFLTIALSLVLLAEAAGGVSYLVRGLFASDELKLLAAMPIGEGTLLFSRLFMLYCRQIAVSLLAVLLLGGICARALPQGGLFWGMLLLTPLTLPLLSSVLSAALAIPWYGVLSFFKERFALSLIAVTALLAAGFSVYAKLLAAVKELLLGDDLKYFFNERVLGGLAKTAKLLYPAKLFTDLITGDITVWDGIALAAISALCLIFSLLAVRAVQRRALQPRRPTVRRSRKGVKTEAKRRPVFYALLKKEFLYILRTPSYAFSCFSIALTMPLMVFACMSVGGSLVKRLVGFDFNAELALFLTLLFGALTNMFCSTNISREGEGFFTGKALPLGLGQIFAAKITFCLLVVALAEGITMFAIAATGYISAGEAALLFLVCTGFSLSQICFATRYDLNHARISTWEDAAFESGGTASACIVWGLALSLLGGGGALLIKLLFALRLQTPAFGLPLALAGGIGCLAAAGGLTYLLKGLKKRYLVFGGNV